MTIKQTNTMLCALRELVRAHAALEHERAAFVASLPDAVRALPAEALAEAMNKYVAALAQSGEAPQVADLVDIFAETHIAASVARDALPAALRRMADGETIAASDYSAARDHDATTGNDRDALNRIMHGSPLRGDRDRVRALADEIQNWKA